MTPTTELMERPADEFALVQHASGAMEIAQLSEQDFETRLDLLRVARERVRRIQRELMIEGEDYGVIPGTHKPTLLKPGAEVLCAAYHYVPTFETQVIRGDGEETPVLDVRVKCSMHLENSEGPIKGEGGGAANTHERKYRYRSGERTCPSCGVVGTIRKSKYPDRQTGDLGWYCHKTKGCGAQFRSDDPQIQKQETGQIDNPDPWDFENTILKMAMKRAFIDCVLRVTATSGVFTQDLEDLTGREVPKREPIQPAQRTGNGNGHTEEPASGDPTVGKVKSVVELQDGAGKPFYAITLTTGYACVTRNTDLAQSARDAARESRLVEAHCKAPSDPAKFKPTLLELASR